MRVAAAGTVAALRGAAVLSPPTGDPLVIGARFCGPAHCANGGYIAGRLSSFFEGPVRVTLRRPVPLDTALRTQQADDSVELLDGDVLLATASAASLELPTPAPPSFAEAERASARYVGFIDHAFPNCFVCGPRRTGGDGLRIFAGPLADRPVVAAVWRPASSLADDAGIVRPEYVWAALDCPGGFAALIGRPAVPVVLGRLTGRVDHGVKAGEACVVIGWPIEHDGRKHLVGTALFDGAGRIHGQALATWIEVPHGDEAGSIVS